MIEHGFVEFVQGNTAVAAIAATGGYAGEVPKNWTLPTWSYTTISNRGLARGLSTHPGLRCWHVQVDCYGSAFAQGADAIALAEAISGLLDGYSGTLPDGTQVDNAQWADSRSFFDAAGRTYRSMCEFEIFYFQ